MMKLYSKAGDDGTTDRPGGRRVRKSEPLVEANGAVDELNTCVGLCLQRARVEVVDEVVDALGSVQGDLMVVGAMLADAGSGQQPTVCLEPAAVARMERQMDEAGAALPDLNVFILPGGTELACRLQFARTICRRAERAVVAAVDAGAEVPPIVLRHLNRLSDLLFVLARVANHAAGVEDETWRH
jgi:cob(I)alamin adenosyltransferase